MGKRIRLDDLGMTHQARLELVNRLNAVFEEKCVLVEGPSWGQAFNYANRLAVTTFASTDADTAN